MQTKVYKTTPESQGTALAAFFSTPELCPPPTQKSANKELKTGQSCNNSTPKNTPSPEPLGSLRVLLPSAPIEGFKTIKGRDKAYQWRQQAADILKGRQALCGCRPITKSQGAAVSIVKKESRKMFFSGLQSCGSVWTCPICALKITESKSQHIASVMAAYLSYKERYSLGFLTLTTRHNKYEAAEDVKNRVLKGWREVQQSRKFRALCKAVNLKGDIRALEPKFSDDTGFHPHLHIALISETTPERLQLFAEEVIKLFIYKMGSAATMAAHENAYKPIYDSLGIAKYISKWNAANELTKHHMKSRKNKSESMTPFQMLDEIIINNDIANNWNMPAEEKRKALDRSKQLTHKFREYATAFKGAKHLTISRGLIEHFNTIASPEAARLVNEGIAKTDEQIVNEKQVGEVMLSFTKPLWKKITSNKIQAQVLNTFEYEGLEELQQFLQEFGVFTVYDEKNKLLSLEHNGDG